VACRHAAAAAAAGSLYQGFVDPDTLLITSQWYSQTVIIAVNLRDGRVTPVTPTDPCQGSWSLQVGALYVAGASAIVCAVVYRKALP
jgi:hypothetical protein